MAATNLRSLVGRLDDLTRRALEAAAGLCLSRSNYNVELEHWLLKLLDEEGSDLRELLDHFQVDEGDLRRELERSLDRLKTGNSRAPALAPSIIDVGREAWLLASLEHGLPAVKSGHVLLAALVTEGIAQQLLRAVPSLEPVSSDLGIKQYSSLTKESREEGPSTPGEAAPAAGGAPAGGGALEQFTIDLTARAKAGEIDPVLGRDSEIRQCIDILTRRRQNNPILTGEPGVGKTAIAEGFALRIAEGDVPPALEGVAVRTLDLALLQAGAGVKGEFENRLKNVVEEVKASSTPIILFIDEAHTLIGAGGSAGQGDAANLLKPALARGELRTIAATTWAEYKKYFERDAALARRFQVVKVEEPSEDVAIQIMRGLVGVMEKHHGVRVLDDAVIDTVRLSSRYLAGRQLPDKSVSVLDTACARVALSQSATPPAIEDCTRRIASIDTAVGILEREVAAGDAKAGEVDELLTEKAEVESQLAELRQRWDREKELVDRARGIREEIEAGEEGRQDDFAAARAELAEVQGESPLVHPFVDSQAVAEVISTWTGIPIGKMVSDEIQGILNLRERLEERVVGQTTALEAISQSLRTNRANLTDPRRPIGVFMLVGTSGVGKTETAVALTDLLYGGEQNMTVINMTEFKEEHKVSLLMGSPPGYVGYGEGGILTEAVRRKPFSVVLLDELEKAHPGVQDVFYQVFDKGMLKDGEGRDIDFRNTVILMTTNAGTDTIMSLFADPETMPEGDALVEALRPELLKHFKPAFLGRVTILPYLPLTDEVMAGIVRLKLGKVSKRISMNYGVPLEYEDSIVEAITSRCTEVDSGARNVDLILNRTLLPDLAGRFLERMAEGREIGSVRLAASPSGEFEIHVS